jgi:hypothetical protein
MEVCIVAPMGAQMCLQVVQPVNYTLADAYDLVCYGRDGAEGGEGFDKDIVP